MTDERLSSLAILEGLNGGGGGGGHLAVVG